MFCKTCGESELFDAVITHETTKPATNDEDGIEIYTAVAEVYGKTYTDTVNKRLPALDLLAEVDYIDLDDTCKTVTAEKVQATDTRLLDGWYAVTEDIVISEHLTVLGNINLILCDGATLTAEKGVSVHTKGRLTIWEQSEGTGELFVSSHDENNVCIVGFDDAETGSFGESIITVNGGIIRTNGGDEGVGICCNELEFNRGSFAMSVGDKGCGVFANYIKISGGSIEITGAYIGILAYLELDISGGSVNVQTESLGVCT